MSRHARRSLAEFTMPVIPATGAIVEPLRPVQSSPTQSNPSQSNSSFPPPRIADHAPHLKIAAKNQLATSKRLKKAIEKAPENVASAEPQAKPVNRADSEGNNLLDAVGEVSSIVTKAAQGYRNWVLENLKSNMAAGLAYASSLTGSPTTAGKHSDKENCDGINTSESEHSASAKIMAAFCGKSFELMSANLDAAVEYAKRLGEVTSASELVQLSTSQARKNVELVVTQAVALGAFSQELVETCAERVNTDLAKTIDG
jgi:Phasin protein